MVGIIIALLLENGYIAENDSKIIEKLDDIILNYPERMFHSNESIKDFLPGLYILNRNKMKSETLEKVLLEKVSKDMSDVNQSLWCSYLYIVYHINNGQLPFMFSGPLEKISTSANANDYDETDVILLKRMNVTFIKNEECHRIQNENRCYPSWRCYLYNVKESEINYAFNENVKTLINQKIKNIFYNLQTVNGRLAGIDLWLLSNFNSINQ